MSHPAQVVAAGAVVFRDKGIGREVLAVHRPRYDDWSLPKGKHEASEALQVTAVREVREETGIAVRLGAPVGKVSYQVPKGRKVVQWWTGYVIGGSEIEPSPESEAEVDQAVWLSLPQARTKLSYADDIDMLDMALARRSAGTLIVVRHAKAMARKNWSGHDWLRPLTAKGRSQALRLSPVLQAYGADRVISSTSTRCVQTMHPFAQQHHKQVETSPLLSEEGAVDHAEEVSMLMWELRTTAITKPGGPAVICGHRPVLPAMLAGLHVEPTKLSPAQCLVLHLDKDSEPISVESIKQN